MPTAAKAVVRAIHAMAAASGLKEGLFIIGAIVKDLEARKVRNWDMGRIIVVAPWGPL